MITARALGLGPERVAALPCPGVRCLLHRRAPGAH